MTYGLGVIDARRTKDGRIRYRVRIPDKNQPSGYLTVGTFDSEAEAEDMRAAAHKARADIGVGCTLEAWGEKWLATIEHQKGWRTVRSTWHGIVAAAPFYREPIDELAREQVQAWVSTLPRKRCKRSVMRNGKRVTVETRKTLSPQMVRHALQKLQLCLESAKDAGLVLENVARGVKLPREVRIEDGWTYLRNDEIAAVMSLPELTPLQRATFGLAIYSGLRAGELACLRWECVHLDAVPAMIEVRRSYTGATKAGKPRTLPLLPAAVAVLRAWQPDPKKRAGLVFPAPGGGEYSEQHRWGWDERYNGRADVPTRAGIKRRVRWHDLRHTTASALISGSWGRAWTMMEVRDYMGHSNITVTQRYAHLAPDALARAAAATNLYPNPSMLVAPATQDRETAKESARRATSCADRCKPNHPARLDPDGQVEDRFTLACRLQAAVAAGRAVSEADIAALARAHLEAHRDPGVRAAASALFAPSLEARLTWALDLSGMVSLERATRVPTAGSGEP